MSPQRYFAKELLPHDVLVDPPRMMSTLSGPAANGVLEAKWANACAASGVPMHGRPPMVVGTARDVDWQLVVIALPNVDEANEAVFVAIVTWGADVRFFYYERCLTADMRALSTDEAMLSGVAAGQRVNYGAFAGLSLEAFVAALRHTLSLPALRLGAPQPPTAGLRRAIPSSAAPVLLLLAAAFVPLALWGATWLGVFVPYAQLVRPVLAGVAMLATLIWLGRTFSVLRGQTSFGPGMAVGGWFIPAANLVLPAVILKDAWTAARGRGGGIVWLWMVVWWSSLALSEAGMMIFDPVIVFESIASLAGEYWFLAVLGVHAAAFGLLALIVNAIGSGSARG